MANYWAITIGINQYRHLQPLMHAQNDALFMHRFFTDTMGIPSDNCVLLSDLATSVGHQVVYPDKQALSEWVQTITQRVQPDDVLWFFFSGYGVQQDGADYLMPIDGDPGQIKAGGLAAVDLVETLAQLPTDKAVLVLDINRSQGAFAGQAIGQEVIDLAQARQLPLLLSCQPEQYSHETYGVRHGLFTAALLEALQQKSTTLSEIRDYVNKRLPELCEHHWRPIQNPVGLIPEAQLTTAVVPESRLLTNISSSVVSEAETATDETATDDRDRAAIGTGATVVTASAIGAGAVGAAAAADTQRSSDSSTVLAGSGGTLIANAEADSSTGAESDTGERNGVGASGGRRNARRRSLNDRRDSSSAIVPAGKNSIVPTGTDASRSEINGARLRNWGLAALAVLMLGVLLKQPFMRTAWLGFREKIAMVGGGASNEPAEGPGGDADSSIGEIDDPTAVATPAVEPVDESAIAVEEDASDGDVSDSSSSEGEEATPTATTEESATDESATAETTVEEAPEANSAEAPAAAGNVAGVQTDATTQALLAEANTALSARQYSEALITLQQVPKDQRDSAFSSILTKARAGAAEAQQYNASVLTDARTSIQPTQASQFTDAIAKARLIKAGEPYYEEAQQDIRSWSQIILDIAEGRATSGNLSGAIAAANVMPYDNAELHQKAKERIVFWQQREQSRGIIQAAQAIPRSGQASSYQKGIVKLAEVSIEHPEYETAQRLSDEWSDRIFSIAQARAAQGRRQAAIQAAVLVPAGTTAYEPTQQAIKRWQAEQ